MDELEISGKRYISSKRIAKENKYHPDYMGQLIRAGKVAGTKVGRAWYVEEESFASYLGQERKPYVPPVAVAPVITEVKPIEIQAQEVHVPVSIAVVEEKKEEVVPISIVKEPVEEKIAREEIFIPERIYAAPAEVKKTKLTYISDSSPLFPEIGSRQKNIEKPASMAIHKEDPYKGVLIQPAHEQRNQKSKIWFFVSATSIVVLGAVVFAFAFFGSVGLDTTVVVQNGKPASVELSQEKTFCFIFNTCQNSSSDNSDQ